MSATAELKSGGKKIPDGTHRRRAPPYPFDSR
jgi:hypothetical protein